MPVNLDDLTPDELADLADRGHAGAQAAISNTKTAKGRKITRSAAETVTPGDEAS